MTLKKTILQALAVATLLILPVTAAQAGPIVGSINLAGQVRITPTTIDWLDLDETSGPPTGEAIVLSSTGYFDDLDFGDIAIEKDLSGYVIGAPIPGGVEEFETFPDSDLPGLNFVLDMILSCGQASNDPGTECLLGLASPFRFDVDAFGTVVIMNFVGRVYDTDDPTAFGIWGGKFSATFQDQTPAQILAAFLPGGAGFVETAYAAQKISAAVPEPATMLTFGLGTVVLAAHRRRRAKKSKNQ